MFEFKYLLEHHIQTEHEDRPFVCEHRNCGKRFKLHQYLLAHLKRQDHADEMAQYGAEANEHSSAEGAEGGAER
jgi:hypothetical protein